MKFRFCGDLDCPDWVLAQIQDVSRLSSIKLKIFTQEITQNIHSDTIPVGKLITLASGAKFTEQMVMAVTASIEFILSSAAKYNTDPSDLSNELQQLGLPKEHASVLSRVYSDRIESLRKSLTIKSLRVNRLVNVTSQVHSNTEQPLIGHHLCIQLPYAQVDLEIGEPNRRVNHQRVFLTKEKIDHMIQELDRITQCLHPVKWD